MTQRRIDARGLACPEPVVQVRKAMSEPDVATVQVTVDSDVSVENIQRMASTMQWDVGVEPHGGDRVLTLTRGMATRPGSQPARSPAETPLEQRVVVFITSDLFGTGDEPLGRVLMRAFVKTLKELTPQPQILIFANSGVRLTTTDSDLLADLRELESQGTRILSCGTCLDYYHLNDALEVGSVTNMFEIASTLNAADRILRP
jgi:selenium metabolism protein YedF